MKYYVAYGSNLSVEQMAHRCPDATIVGTGILKDWRLVFRTHATIEQCKGFSVPVLVWAISERDEARLDRYEGYPRYYVKEYLSVPVTTTTGRFSARAMVYLMAEGSPIQRPSESYFQTIKGGYERFGFDLHVLHDALEDSWYYEGYLTQE
jgi:gamma-glutamylcyclotransferase (GGCT)/AIG2-like uncharacterized protein YtfP